MLSRIWIRLRLAARSSKSLAFCNAIAVWWVMVCSRSRSSMLNIRPDFFWPSETIPIVSDW